MKIKKPVWYKHKYRPFLFTYHLMVGGNALTLCGLWGEFEAVVADEPVKPHLSYKKCKRCQKIHLQAELGALDKMLSEIPTEHVIDRIGLEERKKVVSSRLKRMNKKKRVDIDVDTDDLKRLEQIANFVETSHQKRVDFRRKLGLKK